MIQKRMGARDECRNKGDERNRENGKHRWNSCGSEVGKDEKKRGREPSKQNRKKQIRNELGRKGKTEATEEATGHCESWREAEAGRSGKEKRES